eukprot:1529842-Rhodomonas_salina.1
MAAKTGVEQTQISGWQPLFSLQCHHLPSTGGHHLRRAERRHHPHRLGTERRRNKKDTYLSGCGAVSSFHRVRTCIFGGRPRLAAVCKASGQQDFTLQCAISPSRLLTILSLSLARSLACSFLRCVSV